jgi:hypothetical protein
MEHPPVQFEFIENNDSFKEKHAALHHVYEEFQSFETDASAIRIAHIKSLKSKLEGQGIDADFLIYGSTAAGMAIDTPEKKSDVDVNIVYTATDVNNQNLNYGFSAELFLNALDSSEIKINIIDKPFKLKEIEDDLNTLPDSSYPKMHGEIERFYLSYLQAGKVAGEEAKHLYERIIRARKKNSSLDVSLREIEEKFFPNLNFMGGNIALDAHFKIYTERLKNNPKFQTLSQEDQDTTLARIDTDIRRFI